jgi:CRISPR-associated protein Cmr6
MIPLSLSVTAPGSLPPAANTGLWFDKFCNQWCRNLAKRELLAWSLKSFVTKSFKDTPKGRKEVVTEHNPKLDWIKTVTKPVGTKALLLEHTNRQADLARSLGGQDILFITTSRFVSGLGREHPIENGFVWHPALGTPYLPGSSVKGIVRAWIENGWNDTPIEPAAFHRIFGSDYRQGSGQYDRQRMLIPQSGSILFLDALPTAPVQLKADVMTPHYGDYYQGKSPPADWLSPNPIPFLTVAPGASFQFALAPKTPADHADVATALDWLTQALAWLGAGAKTAVGYGRFERDTKAEAARVTERREEAQREEATRQQAEAKAALIARLANLSHLAQELETAANEHKWTTDKNAFTAPGLIEGWLDRLEADPQPDAIQSLRKLMDHHFPGLLANPDKKGGKKNDQPAFKPRQIALAKRLNALPTP